MNGESIKCFADSLAIIGRARGMRRTPDVASVAALSRVSSRPGRGQWFDWVLGRSEMTESKRVHLFSEIVLEIRSLLL